MLCIKSCYHYRFRRDWEKAVDCLQECLAILEELQREQPSNLAISGEKATAYFQLGEVFMAQYRESNDYNDRKLAEDYLQKSIQIDKELGQDCTATERLLQKMDKSEQVKEQKKKQNSSGASKRT